MQTKTARRSPPPRPASSPDHVPSGLTSVETGMTQVGQFACSRPQHRDVAEDHLGRDPAEQRRAGRTRIGKRSMIEVRSCAP